MRAFTSRFWHHQGHADQLKVQMRVNEQLRSVLEDQARTRLQAERAEADAAQIQLEVCALLPVCSAPLCIR
eukprot:COSAG01_NODE_13290_length_1606_cov_2.605176_1_plen_70_part_10